MEIGNYVVETDDEGIITGILTADDKPLSSKELVGDLLQTVITELSEAKEHIEAMHAYCLPQVTRYIPPRSAKSQLRLV